MKITGPEPVFLYRAYDKGATLLYVGICGNVRLRIGQHATQKPWWNEVDHVETTQFGTRREALDAERIAIEREDPKYNITHSTVNSPTPPAVRKPQFGTPPDGSYRADVSREEGWWIIRIPEVDGMTQARQLSEAGDMAREYLAVALGVDDVEVGLNLTSVGSVIDPNARVRSIREMRTRAAELERRASEAFAQLAKELAKEVPLRDVGTLLGVSYQRAHQLVQS